MSGLKFTTADRFNKTEAGRTEIRARAYSLTRTARNLLFVIDDTRPVSEWITLVNGAGAADLRSLLRARLVQLAPLIQLEPDGPPVAVGWAPTLPVPEIQPPGPPLSYAEFHAGLTELVREQLGLLKGYRISLEIERATGLADLIEVAHRFADEVHRIRGAAASQLVRRALNLPY
jgi:hypothetical protein